MLRNVITHYGLWQHGGVEGNVATSQLEGLFDSKFGLMSVQSTVLLWMQGINSVPIKLFIDTRSMETV